MIGIDLFSGAGGMSLGAEMAGLKTKLAIDFDASAFASYAYNHPDTFVLQADVQSLLNISVPFDSRDIVVFGGPPCQGFSTSNQKTRSVENDKNWLYKSFINFVKRIRPGWVIFENVRGILETEGGMFAEQVEADIRGLGYGTTKGLLNAAEFGVPQVRSRFFLIGRFGEDAPALPSPPPGTALVSVDEAIADLPELVNGASVSRLPYRGPAVSTYSRLMRHGALESENNIVSRNSDYVVSRYPYIPQGGNWADIPEEMMTNYQDRTRCHTGIYRRLRPDAPSVVIGNFRKNMLIHPHQDRGLSVREAARLQSFPDSFVFKGSIGFQQQQVGNAVPPLLAKSIFETVLKAHRNEPQDIAA
ncbi:DNA cytosine methyltransferase [Agrobacterium genomosp. 13]|uniref:DNA (cytosine-5-)-methyltransferase n=1 Tax=Agrobacterium genomosp. 13 str. CFBP 6927 TaxID=1183428 RepID=A0ABM9VLA6_9HYPH|nr:DNA cytosine methyltransferase [Agrobacterium genomosp. 13]CUX58457.1 DNA-cytosine methyltransferase [Agrobacterium genomosp. 13 str. CFBP 6927]